MGGTEDMASEFEKSLRPWVGFIQMFAPGSLYVGLVLEIINLKLPEEFSGLLTVVVGLVCAVAFLVGCWLCLRLPGARKYLAVFSYTMVTLASLSMLNLQTANRQAELPAERLRALQHSATYLRTQHQLSLANQNLEQLVNRTTLVPGDQRTQAAALEVSKEKARQEIMSLGIELQKLETEALGMRVQKMTGPFDLFGPEYAETVREIMVGLLFTGNELTGLSLVIPMRRRKVDGLRLITDGIVKRQIAQPLSSEAGVYLETARRVGKAGKPAGYRRVAVELGISAHHSRTLMRQCLVANAISDGKFTIDDSAKQQKPRWWQRLLFWIPK